MAEGRLTSYIDKATGIKWNPVDLPEGSPEELFGFEAIFIKDGKKVRAFVENNKCFMVTFGRHPKYKGGDEGIVAFCKDAMDNAVVWPPSDKSE